MSDSAYIKYTETILLEVFYEAIENKELDSFFLDEEINLYGGERGKRSLAARWAVKSIIIKHYNSKIGFKDIIITSADNGRPLLKILNHNINDKILISMSHTRKRISAMVVIEENIAN